MNPFEVGRATANAIGKGFQGAQDRTAIDEILETVAQTGDENQVDNAIGQILQRVSPERQSQAMAVLQEKKNKILQNKQLNQQKTQLKALGLPEELAGADKTVIAQALKNKQPGPAQKPAVTAEHLQSLGLSPDLVGAPESVINAALKEKNKPKVLNPFQKKQQTDLATEYSENIKTIQRAKSNIKTIDRLETLSKDLTGLTGIAKGLVGSEKANEFDALGLSIIEPALKLFNPVGAIPTQKINLLIPKFAPKATDRQSVIQGKLNATKRISQQAIDRAQERNAIIDQFQGEPPEEILKQFDADTETMVDALLDMDVANFEPKESNDFPPAEGNEGRIIKDTVENKRYKSNGKTWELVK